MFGKQKYRCEACHSIYPKSSECGVSTIWIGSKEVERLRYGSPAEGLGPAFGRCVDCGVMPGKVHHWNCGMEICPVCGRQLLSCDCKAEIVPLPE